MDRFNGILTRGLWSESPISSMTIASFSLGGLSIEVTTTTTTTTQPPPTGFVGGARHPKRESALTIMASLRGKQRSLTIPVPDSAVSLALRAAAYLRVPSVNTAKAKLRRED